MIQIETHLLPPSDPVRADVAVVIDVLRATSVMATAISNGARAVITRRDIEAARDLARCDRGHYRLGGERDCVKVDGFDFGNSPAEYSAAAVADRIVVLTTTNGTAAVEVVDPKTELLAASFLNLSAAVGRLARAESIALICAGTNGQVSGDDVLLAGAIVARLRELGNGVKLDDGSAIAWAYWTVANLGDAPSPDELAEVLANTLGGRNLIRHGFAGDLSRCANVDSINVVPVRHGGEDRFVFDE